MSKNDSLEIIVRDCGPARWPALTLELDFPFRPTFGRALVEDLPRGARIWHGDGDERWHVHPDFKLRVVELGYEFFSHVYVTESGQCVEQRTGYTVPQQEGLFT